MLRILPLIAAEMRQQLHWIPREEPIYLRLRDDFSIVIIQQSARSPEVNALDLGIWMSVQSTVERSHRNRRRDPDGLAATVKEAWESLPQETIQRVFNRIPIVLRQIVASGGDNITVEDHRGRRNMAITDPE